MFLINLRGPLLKFGKINFSLRKANILKMYYDVKGKCNEKDIQTEMENRVGY